MPKKPPAPVRGDLLVVSWLDICESPGGDTATATVAPRRSCGYFWEVKVQDQTKVLVIHTTNDDDRFISSNQQGWLAFPIGCITNVRIVERVRRPKESS